MNSGEQNTAADLTDNAELGGLDTSTSSGWGEYPLDSVFVRKDQRTVREVVRRIEKNRYVLNPDFQRDFIWPEDKQSRLIESCLMRLPLPVFYVAEDKEGRIIVVDGLQRLSTFTRYLNNDFALTKLGNSRNQTVQKSPLTGKKFNDLPVNLQERIEDTQLTLYILDSKAPEQAKLDIFERVNGGVPLTRQQMRNCLFNGRATQWLKEAAGSEYFLKATGGSLNEKTMRDREAINRFCAFELLGVQQYNADMDDFLAKSLEYMNKLSEADLEKLKQSFDLSMQNNYSLFGKHAFRKSLASPDINSPDINVSRAVINIALFDVCSVMFSAIDEGTVKQNANQLRQIIRELVTNSDFIQAITYATNGLKPVKKRFKMIKAALQEVPQHADTN